MTISVTVNQRIAIYKDSDIVAYIDDGGVPIITPHFFNLKGEELNLFWEMVNKFKVDW